MDGLYIQKVLAGDSNSFAYLVKTYQDMAYSIALSLTKDEFLAEEVAHESFIECYNSLHNFQGKSKFSTWFYRIIVNTAYRTMKKKSVEFIDLDLPVHDVQDEIIPIDKIIAEERKQLINLALMEIPRNESLALRLFYLEELSLEELCEITSWTNSNAKVILHRARKRITIVLNKLLKNEYDEA
ncbi:MAG: sigma-70 family RNA polymerase sigma factor [Sphingobacterium sp.]|jgi:RNA polymerase sigma-70 factor (ECF subfamily)|nr:sigma-70 family RNA polymerase sigma factor [Sphingobacterium sp.]